MARTRRPSVLCDRSVGELATERAQHVQRPAVKQPARERDVRARGTASGETREHDGLRVCGLCSAQAQRGVRLTEQLGQRIAGGDLGAPACCEHLAQRLQVTILPCCRTAVAGMLWAHLTGDRRRDRLRRAGTGLDARTFALVKLAALVALDAPPASYARQIASAVESGVTAEDCLGVLKAIAPQVGGPRVIAAAPEILVAMGLSADEEGQA